MAFYIKVKPVVAEYLGLTPIRNKTKDGNVLLWQADITRFPGETVFDRAAYVGGACLSAITAKEETDGTDNPVEVTVPEWLAPKKEEPTVEEPTVKEPATDDAAVEEVLPETTEAEEGGES